ncbi:MAG TPA: DUF3108 domain-containing protein [Flavisolibacter sp.]
MLFIPAYAQEDFCGIRNTTTQSGEQIDFTVYYNVAGIYVNAGSAMFTTKLEKLNDKPVYHIIGSGRSNSKYDWIFKVRDRYESYVDTATMRPLRFSRDVEEGNTKKLERVSFDPNKNTATSEGKVFKVPDCIQDVLSSVYYARNIDFNKYKKGDKIPFKMFLENEVHNLYIRYIGKEQVQTRYGTFNAIKFKPLLVEGTIFSGGEKMTVWVTDDANRVPVRIESQILIGSVKVDMMGYKNLRHPLSIVKKRQ